MQLLIDASSATSCDQLIWSKKYIVICHIMKSINVYDRFATNNLRSRTIVSTIYMHVILNF